MIDETQLQDEMNEDSFSESEDPIFDNSFNLEDIPQQISEFLEMRENKQYGNAYVEIKDSLKTIFLLLSNNPQFPLLLKNFGYSYEQILLYLADTSDEKRDESNLSQDALIGQITHALEEFAFSENYNPSKFEKENREEAVKDIDEGICHSIVVVLLYHVLKGTQEEFLKKYKNIITWDRIKDISIAVDKMLNGMKFIQQASKILPKIRQENIAESFRVVQDENLIQPVLVNEKLIGSVFSKEELQETLKSLIKADRMLVISFIGHTMGIALKNDIFYNADPNTNILLSEEKYTELLAKNLAEKIFSIYTRWLKHLVKESKGTFTLDNKPIDKIGLTLNSLRLFETPAVEYDNIEKLFINEEAATRVAPDGSTALFLAAQNGDYEKAKLLFEKNPNAVVQKIYNGMTPFHMAAHQGHAELIKLFLTRKDLIKDIDMVTTGGETALYFAAHEGHADVISLLAKEGANTNCFSSQGYTPLFIACHNGHADAVTALLEQKSPAKPNLLTSIGGDSPLIAAVTQNYNNIVKILLEHDADANLAATADNVTPLFKAASYGFTNSLEQLLNKGAQVDSRSFSTAITPLIEAASCGELPTVKLLLDKGADAALSNIYGVTAPFIALQNGHQKTAQYFIDQNLVPLNKIYELKTEQEPHPIYFIGSLLSFACFCGQFDITNDLLNKIDPDTLKKDNSPLIWLIKGYYANTKKNQFLSTIINLLIRGIDPKQPNEIAKQSPLELVKQLLNKELAEIQQQKKQPNIELLSFLKNIETAMEFYPSFIALYNDIASKNLQNPAKETLGFFAQDLQKTIVPPTNFFPHSPEIAKYNELLKNITSFLENEKFDSTNYKNFFAGVSKELTPIANKLGPDAKSLLIKINFFTSIALNYTMNRYGINPSTDETQTISQEKKIDTMPVGKQEIKKRPHEDAEDSQQDSKFNRLS